MMLEEYVYEQPGHLIRRANQLAWAMFREETSDLDVTPIQYSLLVAVHDFPAIDATRLSELICIDRATVGDIISRLETKNLLIRKDDSKDRRAKKIFVTNSGKTLIKSVNKVRGRISDRVLERLDLPDRMMFIKLLGKIVGIDEVKRLAHETATATSSAASKKSISSS